MKYKKVYYTSGKLKTIANYIDNKLHGTFYEYYDNNNIGYVENYKNGKKHGVSLLCYYAGDIRQTKYYNNNDVIINIHINQLKMVENVFYYI